GHTSLVICHWSLVIGHWSLVIGHWSFFHSSFVIRQSPPPSPAAGCFNQNSLPGLILNRVFEGSARRSSLIAHLSFVIICHLSFFSFVNRQSSFVNRQSAPPHPPPPGVSIRIRSPGLILNRV